MTPAEYEEVRELFHAAIDRPPEERARLLDRACAGRAALREEVESLLERDSSNAADEEVQAARSSEVMRFPSEIGHYKILGVLGEGAMGMVYLAEQQVPIRRRVALKVVKLGMDTREVVGRFEAERQALALLNHPNIASVYDAGTTEDGRPYFVMELVEGVPITDYCDRHRLNVRGRLRLFVQVCHGLDHAHRRGIVHRDIKPSNILVGSDGDDPLAKIIDFGVARARNVKLTEKTVYTNLGRAVGTLAYMSPEQAEMTGEAVDHRADIYSLGVVVYELLAGELPLDWEALSKAAFQEILRHIGEEDPPPPSVRLARLNPDRTAGLAAKRRMAPDALVRELQGDLDWVVMRALEKEKERRYGSASRLARDVERYTRGEPVDASPPSPLYRLRRYARRHRAAATAMIGVILGLAIALVATILLAVEARRSARIAGEMARIANERAVNNQALADLQRLRSCRADVEGLWPDLPGSREAIDRWFVRARDLLSRLPAHRAELRKLPERPADFELIQRRATLHELVEELETLGGPDLQYGTVAAVRERVEVYPGRKALEEAWTRAIGAISNPEECPAYRGGVDGLDAVPFLYPIGKDPDSGLWEFVHLRTGRIPERGADGKLTIAGDTGIVLVLLPGGDFLMGSQSEESEGAHYDPEARTDEAPVHKVFLSPFFLAKCEVHQAAWNRVTGSNPSKAHGETLPVERVTWYSGEDFLDRLSLEFPTEAQWEYACRAGTDTPFAGELTELGWYRENSDGGTHPVGSLKVNKFGLHDMHGNVWEWCRDTYGPEFYGTEEACVSDPVSIAGSDERVNRGGSWGSQASTCRSSHRDGDDPLDLTVRLGLRPALRVR